MTETESTLAQIKSAAIRLLAMREHSQVELRTKLGRKYASAALINSLLETLAGEGLQSDQRFAEAYLAMRQRQGKGPQLIKMELRQKGISERLIAELFDIEVADWEACAQNQRIKKFGQALPADPKERARQMRFLQSRGFSTQQIRRAFADPERDI